MLPAKNTFWLEWSIIKAAQDQRIFMWHFCVLYRYMYYNTTHKIEILTEKKAPVSILKL